ncbi:MAG: DUF2752 domain-containing protein [bacterium]
MSEESKVLETVPPRCPELILPRTVWWERDVPLKLLLRNEGLWLLIVLGILGTALVLHPDPRGYGTHRQIFLPPCSFQFITGRPCPTCGLTTSFTAMAHLQLLTAIKANLFGPVIFLGMLVHSSFVAYGIFKRQRIRINPRFANRVGLTCVGVILLYGTIRCFLWHP